MFSVAVNRALEPGGDSLDVARFAAGEQFGIGGLCCNDRLESGVVVTLTELTGDVLHRRLDAFAEGRLFGRGCCHDRCDQYENDGRDQQVARAASQAGRDHLPLRCLGWDE